MASSKNKKIGSSRWSGFTIVELTVVIVVIGILAGIVIIGYSTWRNQIAETEVKNDLSAASSAMESARNFGEGYPTDIPSSFTVRDTVTIYYAEGDGKSFCLEGRSKVVDGLYFFINSSTGNEVRKGTCAGGEGATPDWTIFAYDTTLPGCSGLTIQLPVSLPASSPGSVIDWGDGSTQELTTALQSHTYTTPGEKIVKYQGPISTINTASIAVASRPCLKEVRQWADGISPTTMSFRDSTNIQRVAAPPSTVTNMNFMFYNATQFNQNIGSWNTSNVTSMSSMFYNADAFNQPIGSWDTSKLISMGTMFRSADAFNQPLNNWNTSNVTYMVSMFEGALAFNQPIGSWDTSKVTNMRFMFSSARAFNQPIGTWNTASVSDMYGMFTGAYAFNQPLNTWNVSNVTTMRSMFANAIAFNQPLNSWNTSKVTDMNSMFGGASVFNQNLSSWNVTAVTPKPPTSFDASATAWTLPRPNWT